MNREEGERRSIKMCTPKRYTGNEENITIRKTEIEAEQEENMNPNEEIENEEEV